MSATRKRISYVIPYPTEKPVHRLQLPDPGSSRLGLSGPLLISSPLGPKPQDTRPRHVRHRLGISKLVLDSSTQLSGKPSPEGILYSGGRDGLVISWDLVMPMCEQKRPEISRRWEALTGWDDDVIDEEAEDPVINDGDILGDVTSRSKRKPSEELLSEERWEVDLDALRPGQRTTFRQCAQMHNDWINDILLCNYNQTVISASSDGTVKAWNPHSSSPQDPSLLGTHTDYVRCLASCHGQNWVASGSFDRTIKLWDLSRSSSPTSPPAPLITLNPNSTATKSSVYALASDPYGHVLASGSPEKIIRMWDPRSGKRTAKFVGHTDNIRDILLSEDGRYMLTASSDASIKLWSLMTQRCLHTFTHHTDSVWTLSSSHPSLEIFYSGDRTGLVCRIDVEGCSDVGDGECVVLCNEDGEGINSIAALDDSFMWTVSGNLDSTIKRWKLPQTRATRVNKERKETILGDELTESPSHSQVSLHSHHQHRSTTEDAATLCGIPYAHLVKLESANDPFTLYTPGRDPEVATLYSAASVMSVPHTTLRSPRHTSSFQHYHHSQSDVHEEDRDKTRLEYEAREIAVSAEPLLEAPDDKIEGDHGLVRCAILNDRIHVLTVDTSGEVGVWDLARGLCVGVFPSDSRIERRSAREALEFIREKIEGETVVASWATADTKSGLLTVHLGERCFEAEVYADEIGLVDGKSPFGEESKINVGKWVLKNLFYNFIKEEQRRHSGTSTSTKSRPSGEMSRHRLGSHSRSKSNTTSVVTSSSTMLKAVPPQIPSSPRTSPLLAPMIHLSQNNANIPLPAVPQTPSDATPMPKSTATPGPMPPSKEGDYFTLRTRQPSLSIPNATPISPDDKEQQQPTTPGGLMGRLVKGFGGGKGKRPPSENINPTTPIVASPASEVLTPAEESATTPMPTPAAKTPLQVLLSHPLSPPPSSEVPSHYISSNITIIISDEESSPPTIAYRGTVGSSGYDAHVLEEAMPMWLLEYLLMNKTATTPQHVKVSFVLLPWKGNGQEVLPELLNTSQSKLTANRLLRVKKLVGHVQDKLDKISSASSSRAPSTRSSLEAGSSSPRPEDQYEILCNDVLLPLDMTLASVRQYVWRQSGELVMYYRRKTTV